MTTDLRARLADARLYLCTDARRSQGDLAPVPGRRPRRRGGHRAVAGEGPGGGRGARAARGVRGRLPAARPPAGGERPRGRRARRRAPTCCTWDRTTCRCRSRGASSARGRSSAAAATARPRPTRRPPSPASTTSAPGRCGPRRPSRGARRPASACWPTSRAAEPGPAVVRDRRHQPGPARRRARRRGHPRGRGPRHHRGRRSGRRHTGVRQAAAPGMT